MGGWDSWRKKCVTTASCYIAIDTTVTGRSTREVAVMLDEIPCVVQVAVFALVIVGRRTWKFFGTHVSKQNQFLAGSCIYLQFFF